MQDKQFEKQNVFGKGSENTAYAQYFTGNSYLNPLTSPACKPFFANVTFEPGCRNNWHVHRAAKGGGSFCCAWRAAVGIRNGENPPAASRPETWWRSPQASNTGTAQKRTAGFRTLPQNCQAKERRPSGWSPFPHRSTTLWKNEEEV